MNSEPSNEEKLLNLKRKLLERKSKVEAIVFELQELNQSFKDFKELVLSSEKIKEIKDNTDFASAFNNLLEKIDSFSTKIEKLDFSKLPSPSVIIPKDLKIANIKEAKADKVQIDWENKPKEKFDFLSPIKSLQDFLEPFFKKISNFTERITEYLKEPDRIVISDNKIDEYYGEKKITYRIRDINRDEQEISKEN